MPVTTCRHHRAARITAAVLLCASGLLAGGAAPTAADDVGNASSSVTAAQSSLADDKSHQARLGNVINELTGQISALQTRIAQIQAAIASLDAEIAAQQKVVDDAQAKLDQLTADLQRETDHLAAVRAKLAVDQQSLAAQIVHLYELGPTSTVNAIFSSQNFDEMWQKVIAAKRVGDAEQGQVDAVKLERGQVEQLVGQIADNKTQQEATVAAQQAAEQKLQQDRSAHADLELQLQQAEAADQAQLAAQEQSKREVDAEVAADAAAVEKAKADLAKAIAAAAARAKNPGTFRGGGNGHFIWPLDGNISQYFGCTSWPYENYDFDCPYPHRFHTGLDISTSWGTPIVAADAGIVYTYYSNYGYGNHIIMIHGNNWSSLYGHMASFAVPNGAIVGRGQVIGYEGSTGNSSGPHCHFEVRLNDVPQNPLDYLP